MENTPVTREKKPTQFRLSNHARALLAQMAKVQECSQAEIVEALIREAGHAAELLELRERVHALERYRFVAAPAQPDPIAADYVTRERVDALAARLEAQEAIMEAMARSWEERASRLDALWSAHEVARLECAFNHAGDEQEPEDLDNGGAPYDWLSGPEEGEL